MYDNAMYILSATDPHKEYEPKDIINFFNGYIEGEIPPPSSRYDKWAENLNPKPPPPENPNIVYFCYYEGNNNWVIDCIDLSL